MGLLDTLKKLQTLPDEDTMPNIDEKPKFSSRSRPLGPKQLQWCRDNLANFAKYESQAKASRGEK